MPSVNMDAMQSHLEQISKNIPPNKHGVVVLDRAGWHTSQRIGHFPNLSLLSLPPASPELNPQEQVWQQLRDRYLANRCFKNYEDIVQSCCGAGNQCVQVPGNVSKLCSRQWINLLN